MDTWEWLPFVQRRWKTILVTLFVVVLVTMGVTIILPPVYRSTATIAIQPLTLDTPLPASSSLELGVRAAGELIKSPSVMKRAERLLGNPTNGIDATLEYRVVEDTNLLEIAAEAESPTRAAKVANAVAEAFLAENAATLEAQAKQTEKMLTEKLARIKTQVAELQKELGKARTARKTARVAELQDQITTLETASQSVMEDWQTMPANQMQLATAPALTDKAVPDDSPARPRPTLNFLLSLVAGLFAGLGVARLLDSVRPPEKAPDRGSDVSS